MRTAFIKSLVEMAAANERIWLLTADLGYSVLEAFAQRFPRRYLNVGVAEQNLTGIAAGMARCGKVVFTYSIANFPTFRCLEQVRNDVCYHRLNVKVVAVGGGFTYGPQGYTHHGLEDLAVMSSLPGMVVLAPGDPLEAAAATQAAVRHDGPCYLRLGKAGEPVVHAAPPAFEIGRGILVRDGSDVTLISTGGMLKTAVEAAAALAGEGISARVVSMPTVKPLDRQAVQDAARQTRAIVTMEEHSIHGGLGTAVAEVLAESQLAVPFRKIALPDRLWSLAGSQAYFRAMAGDPVAAARELLAGRRRQ